MCVGGGSMTRKQNAYKYKYHTDTVFPAAHLGAGGEGTGGVNQAPGTRYRYVQKHKQVHTCKRRRKTARESTLNNRYLNTKNAIHSGLYKL